MAGKLPAVEQLRLRAAQSVRLRPLLALADGIGLALLCLAGMLGGQGYAATAQWQLLTILFGVPLLQVACCVLLDWRLRPAYARHHAAILQHSELLLRLVEPEAPATQAQAAQLLRVTALLPAGFEQRLKAALLRWEALCRACGQPPYPAALELRLLPVLLAALWALAALALQHRLGLHPLTPPVLFLLTAGLYLGLQRAIGRDSFALALAQALDGD